MSYIQYFFYQYLLNISFNVFEIKILLITYIIIIIMVATVRAANKTLQVYQSDKFEKQCIGGKFQIHNIGQTQDATYIQYRMVRSILY